MFEVSGLSKKDIQEEYEDLVFRKVMAIYVENESKQILAEIKAEKENNKVPVDTRAIEKLYDKKERRENLSILWKYSKKVVSFAAMIVFVAIISLSSAVVAFADVREAVVDAIYHLIYEENERYTQVAKGESIGFVDAEIFDWEGAYAPTYIPDGYEVREKKSAGSKNMVIYEGESGHFTISQTKGEINARIDTENAQIIEKIIINDSEALLVEKDGFVTIAWSEGETFFSVRGELYADKLVLVSEGLKIKN